MVDLIEDPNLHFSVLAAGMEPNDTFATAETIVEGTHTIAGTGIDWYQFEASTGLMNFSMTPAAGTNLNMELRNSSNQVLAANFAATTESISRLSAADGTYYLKIYNPQFPSDGGAEPPGGLALNYSLSIDLPAAYVPEAGDTFATAVTLAEGTHTISSHAIDWYKFDSLSGLMNFSMTPAAGTNLNMELRNSSNQVLAANFAATTESISRLAATDGTYYLKIYNPQFPGDGGAEPPGGLALNYSLSIDLPEQYIPEAGDSQATAVTLTEGTYTISSHAVDWYKFDSLSGLMSFSMTPAAGTNLNLELHDISGAALDANFQTGTESFSHLAGTDAAFFLKVYDPRYPDATNALPLNYTLSMDLPELSVRGPNDPGETEATATDLAQGAHSIIGTGVDWFRIETGPGRMALSMTPTGDMAQPLNMVLYDSAGTAVRSNPTVSGAESFDYYAARSGTYYLNVINSVYTAGTPNGVSMTYDLNVDLPDKTFSLVLPFGPVVSSSIAVYDIDNDGEDEIFVGTAKTLDDQGNEVQPAGLIVLEADGTVKWTKSFEAMSVPDPKTGKMYDTTSITTAPVFSDVNGDGKIDIVLGVGAYNRKEFDSVGQPGDKGGVYAVDAQGNTLWFHQTRDSFGDDNRPDGVYGTPVIFDIDSDGVREVIFASWDHYLYVLDGRTGVVEQETDLHDTVGASPTIADLNGDGLYEIIIPSDITNNAAAGLPNQGGVLHIFNNQLQQIVPGWNQQIASSTDADFRGKFDEQSIWSTAQVADIDRDGKLEIVVGTGNFFQDARGSYIKVWEADGTLSHQLDTNGRTFASPLLADIDNDGRLDIIAGTVTGYVHAWKADGTPIFTTHLMPYGAPAGDTVPIVRKPIAVDMNGDGKLEILLSAGAQTVVLSSTGDVVTSTTEPELIHYGYEGTPVARDIDGDGYLDIISGGRNVATNQALILRFENLYDTQSSYFKTAAYQSAQSLQYIQTFVSRFYETILGREADAAGLNSWTDLLQAGIRSGSDVATGFVFSPEFTGRGTSDLAYVNTLYSAFFGRAADASAQTWVARLDSGVSRASVLNGFIGSQEFANLSSSFGIRAQNLTGVVSNSPEISGTATDSNFLRGGAGDSIIFDGTSVQESRSNEADVYGQVYRLYQATLGRSPDQAGFAGWANALTDGRIQLAQASAGFVESAEFKNTYGSQSNESFVELLYKNVLGRDGNPDGIAAWTALLDKGTARSSVVLGFSESREFQNNSNPGLDSLMRLRTASWHDAIEGGAGNDTMNGGVGSDTFIFRKGQGGSDVINGFEPWDNLQLSGFGFATKAQAVAAMQQAGSDVTFDMQGQAIRFTDTTLAQISRARFNVS